jgi:hypothetical protein
MSSRNWLSLYLRLAISATLVCCGFGSRVSFYHVAAIVLLGVAAPLVLAWLGGRFTQDAEVAQRENRPVTGLWVAVALFIAASFKFAVLGFTASRFVPALHDEWSYLFGGQTYALGRLYNATPPHADFFDAFHILLTPAWMTRYPPGHPAALALGVLVGWPPAAMISLAAGTVVWIYVLAREVADESSARLAAALAIMSPGMDYLSSCYLSQSTFLFTMTGCYAAAVLGLRQRRLAWLALAGFLGGWAILTRPYSAVALGGPLAAWLIWSVLRDVTSAWQRAILLSVGAIPVVGSVALFGVVNASTTGQVTLTAWGEYNRQFEPDNTMGFSSGKCREIPVAMHRRKAARAQSIAQEKSRYTWHAAACRTLLNPQRLAEMTFAAVGFYGLIAFVPAALRTQHVTSSIPQSARWLLLIAPVTHYLAYAFFYSAWGVYAHETIPFLVVLVAVGLVEFWRCARDSARPGIALVLPMFLVAALAFDGVEIGRFIARRRADTQYHRDFARKLEKLSSPSIVFVRYDRSRLNEYDLIHNSPDLDGVALVVLDLGDRNHELLESFPDRRAYLYDDATGQLTEWTPPPPVLPARSPDPQRPAVATERPEPTDARFVSATSSLAKPSPASRSTE